MLRPPGLPMYINSEHDMWRFSNHTYIFLLGCDVDCIPFADICMDLAMTQVTLQSMEKHSVSTISAMAPETISPWIVEVNGKVQVTMAYVVTGQTIHEGTDKETVPGCSPKPIGGERGAQRRQVEHTLLRIPFGNVHENLKILDKWSSQRRLA